MMDDKRIPNISVIMSVYNSEKYVGDAIESVLSQTYSNFELLIIDDCSTDGSREVINSYSDSRIVLFTNSENKGLTRNLNFLIKKSRGKLIARLDADDICEPDRLMVQSEYLDSNPSVHMVSSNTLLFGDESGIVSRHICFEETKAALLFGNPITHSSVMFRKDMDFLYDEDFTKSQDYELWDRFVHSGKVIYSIDKILVRQRIHSEQITKIGVPEQEILTLNVMFKALKRLGIELTEEEKRVYANAIRCSAIDNFRDWICQYDILTRINNENRKRKLYSRYYLRKQMRKCYLTLFLYSVKNFKTCGPGTIIRALRKTGLSLIIKRFGEKYRSKK